MKRRKFIQEAAVAGGLLAAFPWLYSCSSRAKKEIKGERARIAVIGTGSRGLYLIRILLNCANAEIVALCDDFPPHLQNAAALCPKAKTFSDYRAVLDLPEVDAIFIVTPLHEHAHVTLEAFEAGKHVLCEKSMALTLDDCLDMYNAYKESGKVLLVGQQRLFDPKYLRAIDMIHSGTIGMVTGIRCYWFRNHDWRRPVPEPSLERKINWRLYKEYSGGLMTELATHQLQVGNWVMKMIPEEVVGMGDIVFWKDGREVYDNLSLVYRYENGVKMTYESIISNKFNGLEEQILGNKGTMELERGRYYYEEVEPAPGILQLINQVERGIFDNMPFAGPSWVPETAVKQRPVYVMDRASGASGASSVGADADGTSQMVESFCHSVITGKPYEHIVEEAYYSSTLALMGIQAMEEKRMMTFPDKYKIPYLNFA